MGLFEVLLIAFFVILPLVEGIAKRKRDKGPGSVPPTSGGAETGRRPGQLPREPRPSEEPAKASDMVPQDLWELLTGERRHEPTATGEGQEGAPETPEPWVAEPEWGPTPIEPDLDRKPEWGRRVEPAAAEPPSALGTPDLEPVSLEYVGPEAYSLETEPPPPAVRHARFHEKIDELRSRQVAQRSPRRQPLARALREPGRLREAVLLKEILGPPKGLD